MLLADLVDRGLDPEQAILFVIDGGKALRKAIKDVFGQHALVHRCHRHKERNVTDLLPERDRPQMPRYPSRPKTDPADRHRHGAHMTGIGCPGGGLEPLSAMTAAGALDLAISPARRACRGVMVAGAWGTPAW